MDSEKIKTNKSGVAIYGNDGLWVLDASTILNDGVLAISMCEFEIIAHPSGPRHTMYLKLKRPIK